MVVLPIAGFRRLWEKWPRDHDVVTWVPEAEVDRPHRGFPEIGSQSSMISPSGLHRERPRQPHRDSAGFLP